MAIKGSLSLEEQLHRSSGGQVAFEKLLNAGCKRAPLLFVLDTRQPSKRDWKRMRETYAPDPARIRMLAERLEKLAAVKLADGQVVREIKGTPR